jgi:hypothetical protein
LSLTDRGMANVDRFSEEPDLRFLRRVHCHWQFSKTIPCDGAAWLQL